MRNVIKNITKIMLAVAFIAIVAFGFIFTTPTLGSDRDLSYAESDYEVYAYLTGTNERKMDYTGITASYVSGSDNVVEFVITIKVTNKTTKNEYTGNLPFDVTVYYSTYDLSAVSTAGYKYGDATGALETGKTVDYNSVVGSKTFYSGSTTRSYTVKVKTNVTEYGIYYSEYSSSSITTLNDKDGADDMSESAYNVDLSPTNFSGVTDYSTIGYCTRYFGFKITDVEGINCTYNTASKYGVVPVDHYYAYCTTTLSGCEPINNFKIYNYLETFNLSDITELRGDPKTSYVNVKSGDLGKIFSDDYISTNIEAHWYFTGEGRIHKKYGECWQNDSGVGLWYDTYSKFDKSEFNSKPNTFGTVTFEMDGYPYHEFYDFGYWGSTDSNVQPSHGEIEYSDSWSKIHEKVQIYSDDSETYYRVLGDPNKIGIAGVRDTHGDNRYLYDLQISLQQVDDTPISIESMYIDAGTITVDDTLRIKLRLSEPVYINTNYYDKTSGKSISDKNNTPQLIVQPNNGGDNYYFSYESGSGTDTLVFSYKMSNLNYFKEISEFTVVGITYPENVCDFSGANVDLSYTNEQSAGKCGGESYKKAVATYTYEGSTVVYYRVSQWNLRHTVNTGYDSKYYNNVEFLQHLYTIDTDGKRLSIDARNVVIDATSGITTDSEKIAKTHTAKISFNSDCPDINVYYMWSDDYDGKESGVITRPDIKNITTEAKSSGTTYNITSSQLTGTRFLWIYVKSKFGREDLRLCGPFYFDNSYDNISDIKCVDENGNVLSNASSPEMTRYFEFTILHDNDYRTASATKRIDLLWSTDSPWTSNSVIYINNDNSENPVYSVNGKQNTCVVKTTTPTTDKHSFVYKATDNLLKDDTIPSMELKNFYKLDDSGKEVIQEYTYSTTYRIQIGYGTFKNTEVGNTYTVPLNTFCLKEGEFKKVYIGFLSYDANGNHKNYTDSSQFIAGKDYLNDTQYYFDTRDIIVPLSTTFPTDKAWDYLYNNHNISDSSIKVFDSSNINDSSNKFTFKLTLPATAVSKELADTTKSLSYKIVVKKPNTVFKTKDFTITGESFSSRTYTSEEIKVGTTTGINALSDEYSTKWFTVKFGDIAKGTDNADYYTSITVTFLDVGDIGYTDEDGTFISDLDGYYDISFKILKTDSETSKVTETSIQSTTFYLASGEDETHNLGDNQDNDSIYNVYQLDAETKYFYKNTSEQVQSDYYTSNNGEMPLMFSSKAYLTSYLKYIEYQDFALVKVTNENQSTIATKRASGDSHSVTVGDYWIRYKSVDYSDLTEVSTTMWAYYYYADKSDTDNASATQYSEYVIDLTKIKDDSALAIVLEMVVQDIISEHGRSTTYVTADGMDTNSVDIHKNSVSVQKNLTGQTFLSGNTFSGDPDIDTEVEITDTTKTGISNGTVFINKVYRLDSNARFYYLTAGSSIVYESYTESGAALTMSSEEVMRDYLRYMEYNDLYLWKITSQGDAQALNSSSGGLYNMASGEKDSHTAAVGQIWIRYKKSTWTDSGSQTTGNWVYYWYSDDSTATEIDVNNFTKNLQDAINNVIDNIIDRYGSTVLLTGEGNLDANGAPYLSEDSIMLNEKKLETTLSGSTLDPVYLFIGDSEIYSSEIEVDGTNYILASTAKIKFNDYSRIYITPLFGSYSGIYGVLPRGNTIVLKNAIDDIYRQIHLAYNEKKGITSDEKAISNEIAPSGAYRIIEVDEYGARYLDVYIDKTTPQLNFYYTSWTSEKDSKGNTVAKEQARHAVYPNDTDYVINAVEFTITGIGLTGVIDSYDSDGNLVQNFEEVDIYSYIAIYQGATLLCTYTLDDFAKGEKYKLDDGKYTIYVYDRSGNYYGVTVRVNSEEIVFNVSYDENVYMTLKNRTEDDMKEFYVEFDGNTNFDIVFDNKKTYYDSGTYVFHIVDWYGNTINETVVFSRKLPTVTWKYAVSSGFALVNDDSPCTAVEKLTSNSYRVSTSVPVGFQYSSTAGISYEFIGTAPEVNVTSVKNVSVEQKDIGAFKVKVYYTQYPSVYVIYDVIVDTTAPNIFVSYDQYDYELRDGIDAGYQMKIKNEQSSGYYKDGDIITPTRIDYSLLSSSTYIIGTGSQISTDYAKLELADESGISRLVVTLDGNVLYDGAYNADGIYKYTYIDEATKQSVTATVQYAISHVDKTTNETIIEYFDFNNTFSQYGDYVIYAYDVLNNKATFKFTNTKTYDVEYYVDNVRIEDTLDYVYETDRSGNPKYDSNGDPIIKESWRFAKKFVVTSDDESKVKNKGKDGSGAYVRNTQEFTKVEYGNETQLVRLSLDAEIVYLFTVGEGEDLVRYFIGFKYIEGELYSFVYHASVLEEVDELGNKSTVYTIYPAVSEESIISIQKAVSGKVFSAYEIKSLDVTISAYFDDDGYLNLSTNVPSDTQKVITIETRVSSTNNSYEPAYFKTKLSLLKSDVTIRNEYDEDDLTKGVIDTSLAEENELIYTHGDKLFIKDSEIDTSIIDTIKISYSYSNTFNTYYYLYSKDGVDEDLMYKYEDADGYYCIQITNLFGNVTIHRFAVSNSLLVTSIATYVDGWTRDYPTNYTDVMRTNSEMLIQFQSGNIVYKAYYRTNVLQKYEAYKNYNRNISSDSISLIFKEKGYYYVDIVDEYGNSVTKTFEIAENKADISWDIFTTENEFVNIWDKEAYVNQIASIDEELITANGVTYLSYIYGEYEYIIFDKISYYDERYYDKSGKFLYDYDPEKLKDVIGNLGSGEYTVIFRDAYGNTDKKIVNYRKEPTLVLSRLISTSSQEEKYSLDLATSIGFWSNYVLKFNSEARNYKLTINGAEVDCEKVLNFSTNDSDSSMSYDITYSDEYGYSYSFKAYLYRTKVNITPSETMNVVDVDDVHFTNHNVIITFDTSKGLKAWYNFDGGAESIEYTSGTPLKVDGKYVFSVQDYAGNISHYTIVRDSVVYYVFRAGSEEGTQVKNGFVTNSSDVVFTSTNGDTSYIKQVFRNDKLLENYESSTFSQDGKWEFIIADSVGNESYILFYIISHELNYLKYYVPQNYEFSAIWYYTADGSTRMDTLIETDDMGNKYFEFTEDGEYLVTMNSTITGVASNFTFALTTEKPIAELSGCANGEATINNIKLSNTVKGDTIYVYKDGELVNTLSVDYDGETVEISEEGDYRVVVESLAGNTVEYTFTRKHVANTAGSALIIIFLVLASVGLFIGLLYRNRSRVDK